MISTTPCTCDPSAPHQASDCLTGTAWECDVYLRGGGATDVLGCRCMEEPLDPFANQHRKRGCLSATTIDVVVIPRCVHETTPFRPAWLADSAGSASEDLSGVELTDCLEAFTMSEITWNEPLANLNSCECVDAGGTPVVGHFPEVGARYAGCGQTALVPSARPGEMGYCGGPINGDGNWQLCAWFPRAFLPTGWELHECTTCD